MTLLKTYSHRIQLENNFVRNIFLKREDNMFFPRRFSFLMFKLNQAQIYPHYFSVTLNFIYLALRTFITPVGYKTEWMAYN